VFREFGAHLGPEIATLKLRSARAGISKTSPADADRFSAEYDGTETRASFAGASDVDNVKIAWYLI